MSTPEDPATEEGAEQSSPKRDDGTATGSEQTPLSEFDREELATLVAELRSENRRLRADYAQAKQRTYQWSSIALLVLGVFGVLGALALPAAREVLFILAGAGLFAGVLTRYLTPEQFIPATMGKSVYDAVAEMGAQLRGELGLDETYIYVPTDESGDFGVPVRLFVPQSSSVTPSRDELTSMFVLSESADQRGVSLRPTAARLVAEFNKSAHVLDMTDTEELAAQLVDALVEQFELVEQAVPEVDPDSGRLTVSVQGGPYGVEASFDHPVASFFGTGLAFGLDQPVTVETVTKESQLVVTCRW
jgi:hypothetical protein